MEWIKVLIDECRRNPAVIIVMVMLVFNIIFENLGIQEKANSLLLITFYIVSIGWGLKKLIRGLIVELERFVDSRSSNGLKLDKHDLELKAYHEAGHALVSRISEPETRIIKITIVPTPKSTMAAHILTEYKDNYKRKSDFLVNIRMLLGGMAAEELIYGEHSTGAYLDLRNAKRTAFDMLENYGMGIRLIYNRENHEARDDEANEILLEERKNAKEILEKNLSILKALKEEIILKESMKEEEIIKFFESHGI